MILGLTGGTGFVGGHVMREIAVRGHRLRALTRKPQAARDGVEWIGGTLEDEAALAALCAGVDAIVHVAGVTNAPDAAGFDHGNRVGTLAVLHAAEVAGVDRFVHISSLAAREPELSIYGASKRAAEDAVVTSALDWRIVRPPAIYGPGDTDNLELFKFARRGFLPLPPTGRMSVIHASDLARLIVALAEGGPAHAFYEVDDGMPGGWTHADYARAIASAVGRKPLIARLPRSLLDVGARIDGALRGKNARLTPDRVAYFCHSDWTVDPDKRPPADVWTPQIGTAAGLAATAAWYRAEGWL